MGRIALRLVLPIYTAFVFLCACAAPPVPVPQGAPAQAAPAEPVPLLDVAYGLCLDSKGRIYVSDWGQRVVYRIDAIDGSGLVALRASPAGDPLVEPYGLWIDAKDRLYIADRDRVVRVDDMTGNGWVEFSPSRILGRKFMAMGVCSDLQGRIYAADNDHDRIVRVDAMDGSNAVAFGSSGVGAGQFARPGIMETDRQGRIYIMDCLNNRVVRIDDISGAGWTTLTAGTEPWYIAYAFCLAPDGSVYVSDSHGGYIRRAASFSARTTESHTAPGVVPDSRIFPIGIKVDVAGHIYFVDSQSARVVRMDDLSGKGFVAWRPMKP